MAIYDSIRILCVDDYSATLETVADILRRQFSEVYTATNGREGLALFETHRPDIVMTDISMPVMDGIEMAKAIREREPSTHLIIHSAFSDPSQMSCAINIGIDGYLGKPLQLNQLTDVFTKIAQKIENRRRALYESKLLQQYKHAVDEGSMVSKTDPEGVITYANDAFCTISGYRRDELIGRRHGIIRHPDTPDELFQTLWSTIRTKRTWRGTIKNRRKDGSSYYVSSVIIPILDEHDDIVEFLALNHDITEQEESGLHLKQRIEEEVLRNIEERKSRELERVQSAKFMAIGRLAAGITHEINTPLTYIRGNLEMLRDDIRALGECPNAARMLEDIEIVLGGVGRIAGIVESMREMSSHSKEIKEPINVYATLQTALIMAYNRSKHVCNITIQGEPFELGMDKEAHRFLAPVQKQRLEQVWVIIIGNALDALNSHLDVFENRRLDITVSARDGYVCVHFRDNGGGIDPEVLPRIFEPFQSTKEEGGIGIGLNVAKKIIDDHQGSIIASNDAGGACFQVCLPTLIPQRTTADTDDAAVEWNRG